MVIDIVLLVFAIWGGYQGFKNGLVFTIFRMLALMLGILLAIKFTPNAATFLKNSWGISARSGVILGFLGILALVYLGVFLIGKLVELLLKLVQLGLANRIAGAAISIAVYIFLFSSLLRIADNAHIISDTQKQQSKAYPLFVKIAPHVTDALGIIIPPLKNLFTDIKHVVDNL